jgi:hypothetical protein
MDSIGTPLADPRNIKEALARMRQPSLMDHIKWQALALVLEEICHSQGIDLEWPAKSSGTEHTSR